MFSVLVVSACLFFSFSTAAWALSPGWSVKKTQPTPDVVYDWSMEACDPNGDGQSEDAPDMSVGAFRFTNSDHQSMVQMNYGHEGQNRRLLGPFLQSVKREKTLGYRGCGADITYLAEDDARPETFNNNQWVMAPYFHGGVVYSLVHNEYHGKKFGVERCPSTDFNKCWKASMGLVRSTGTEPEASGAHPNELGAEFTHHPSAPDLEADPPEVPHLVASIPFQYEPDWGKWGYEGGTNIIEKDGAFYFLVQVTGPGGFDSIQKPGICLLRTTTIADPDSWRAWDGRGFTVRLIDPYHEVFDPADHVCAPVSRGALRPFGPDGIEEFGGGMAHPRSLTYNTSLERYMLVGTGFVPYRATVYSLSEDLVNWSEPQVILREDDVVPPGDSCPERETAYPSILDPSDPAQTADPTTNPKGYVNFDHPDRTPGVYYTATKRDPDLQCKTPPGNNDTDLLSQPVEFMLRRATIEDGALVHPETGFDHGLTPQYGYLTVESGDAYDGSKSARAVSFGGFQNPGPRGKYDVSWGDAADVWYGAAFKFQPNFKAGNGDVGLIRWEDSADSGYGGLFLRSDDTFRIVRGKPGTLENLGPAISIADDTWTWVEVHQVFSQTRPITEVFVNGRLLWRYAQANHYPGGKIADSVSYGYASLSPDSFATLMSFDRASIDASERGPVGAPATPLGLVNTATSGSNTANLEWNAQGTSFYRVYRRDFNNGLWRAWVPVGESALPALSNTPPCGKTYQYRVSAFLGLPNAQAQDVRESVPTAPLEFEAPPCA